MNADTTGRILDLVHKASGLCFTGKKIAFFERRLKDRLTTLGLDDVESYISKLRDDPEEIGELVQTLTTTKTYFMRNLAQFRALGEKVLPGLIAQKNMEVIRSWGAPVRPGRAGGRNPAMRLRLWSAGCSTGEEPYTMAFTLLEALQYPKAWDVEILATDITRRVLEAAEAGVYDARSVADLPERLRSKYMEPVDEGWRVGEAARRLVGFYESNLMGFINSPQREMLLEGLDGNVRVLSASGYFDVVFCRNVMIYFDRAGQDRLVRALYDSLRPGGALFTGDSEPLHLFEHGFVRADDKDALYYIKPA